MGRNINTPLRDKARSNHARHHRMRSAEIAQARARRAVAGGNRPRNPGRGPVTSPIGRMLLDIIGKDGSTGLLGKVLDQLAGASDRIIMAPGIMDTEERRLMVPGLSGAAIQQSRFRMAETALAAYVHQNTQRNRQSSGPPNPRLELSTTCGGEAGSHFEFDLAAGLYRLGTRRGALAQEQVALEQFAGIRDPFGKFVGAYVACVDGWERTLPGLPRQEFAHIAVDLTQQIDQGQLIAGPMQVLPTT